MLRLILVVALSVALSSTADAQIPMMGHHQQGDQSDDDTADMGADAMVAQMQAAQAHAQAQAARPGDDALTCDELQSEFTTTLNDPTFRQATAGMGQWAQSQQGRMNEARSRAMGMAGMSMVTGIISSFVPFGGYAQMAAAQAQARMAQSQTAQHQQEMMAQAGNMQAMLPMAYRAQRLYQLGQAKSCSFSQPQPPGG